jgi:hypothetical protein
MSTNQSPRPTTIPILLTAALLLGLYAATLAQYPVLGDPTEYTYVAHVLGVAHPPGYAFFTLLGKLWQTIIPLGSIAWRMHLLAAVGGTITALCAGGTVWRTGGGRWAAVATIFLVGTGVNHWQHSIHANPHIWTAAFLAANLYMLTSWAATQNQRWLFLFCLSTGLGVAHHPLTVFSFPAYALFVVWQRPTIWREWRTLLAMFASALLGLSLFLYFPWRSPQLDAFWPQTMNAWEGFSAHVLARGLSDSLPYYTLADHPLRLVVFASIVRINFSWAAVPVSLLALFGLIQLWRRPTSRPTAALLTLTFATNYAFILSLKAQDIMAYSLGLLVLVGVLAGRGAGERGSRGAEESTALSTQHSALSTSSFLLLTFYFSLHTFSTTPLISLRHYDEGVRHVAQVFEQFAGQGEGVVLLNNWEFMTPLWYTQLVEKRWPDEADVRPLFVSAAEPWLPSVFNYLPGGPVYLNSYRREIVEVGFRLRPRGAFYQVVEPGDTSVPEELTRVETAVGEGIEIVGYGWPDEATAGEFVPFTLAMRLPLTTTAYYAPVLQVGEISYPFTTDTHLTTPLWQAAEVIVERFDFALPHNLPAGNYPARVRLHNLSADADSGLLLELPPLVVLAKENPPDTAHLLANFRQRVGLVRASAWHGARRTAAPWSTPLTVEHGDVVNIFLEWEALAHAEESYTVFFHLNQLDHVPVAALDYTPLGGAMPTHLWFPKWLPGQRMTDPYRLMIDPNLPPGRYYIEVGLYEMTSGRRLHQHDPHGNLAGDRAILGEVVVE